MRCANSGSEHRFRPIRFVKLPDGPTVRIDPRSILFTGLDTGAVLDVDVRTDAERRSAGGFERVPIPGWPAIELVAIDMSAEFGPPAVTCCPPAASWPTIGMW